MGFFWSVILILFSLSFIASSETNILQTFIVRVENTVRPSEYSDVEQWYSSILKNLNSDSSASTQILHVYKTVFEGFSAKLIPDQVQELEKRPEIIALFPEHTYYHQTTRSPDFLGLRASFPGNMYNESEYGDNVIIGLLDSGIWPELSSFDDEGLGPIPSHWKGECRGGEGFRCNKKLIGARFFNSKGVNATDGNTTRDAFGHGTHTASTAAGRAVSNADFLGFAEGTAVGVAPKARVAMYKVCYVNKGCGGADILAGFDKAVEDGVNVISVSLGSIFSQPLIYDEMAIGSFGAMEKGVIVTAAAGNAGEFGSGSVCNVAPWMITVGASTIDRKFPADILLEGGGFLTGISLFDGADFFENEYWPLIYGGNASLNNSGNAAYCRPDSLDKQLVRGKIVVCDYGADFGPALGLTVKKSGGVGVIVAYVKPDFLMAEAYLTPGLSISSSNRQLLFDYMFSTANPRATIQFRGTQLGIKPAPVVADFSSRGPNKQSRYVMKPDVIAPGVDILAGWSQLNPPTRTPEDKRRTEFNIISGTSMACPHVSGIAALLKGMNPDWSPAMIKSAIMTTAYTHDRDGNPILEEPFYSTSTPWDMGSGHLDPQKAQDPGLVYDITSDDYVEFLCASNLTKKDIKIITRRSSAECESTLNPWDINYPAISVAFEASKPYIKMIVVKRTMTNVGDEMSNYTVAVNGPKGVSVTVDPPELVFKSKGEKLSYMVRIVPYKVPSLKYKSEFGHFVWSDGTHYVTSPLVVTWHA